MNSLIDVIITLELGERRRQISVAALARATGQEVAALRRMLLVLLQGTSGVSVAATDDTGFPHRPSSTIETVVSLRERNENIDIRSYPREPGSSEQEERRAVDNSERLADYLADVLRDPKSRVFYKIVAASVPREVVGDALARALDVPRRDVRKSRAAIFTTLIRPYLRARGSGSASSSL